MIRVSVLVPIYNVEKFLPECLDSLVNQTLKDIEIICINDGSTDRSPQIIQEYAKKDKRIKVINKKNSGYGDSMNQGLKKAKGEYVGIVESDDFIDLDAFEKLYKIAKKYDCDVVKSNFYEYYGDEKKDKGKSNLFLEQDLGRVLNPRESINIFYQAPCIWAAIYKRSFLEKNEIDFLPTPGASYQDTGFNLKVWSAAKRVYFVDQAFLHYRQDNSNSSVKDSGKIYCVSEEYKSIEEFLRKRGDLEELGPIMVTSKFGAYIWNLRRLSFKAAMKFAKQVKKEYKDAEKKGFLNPEKLDDVGKYNARLMATKQPVLYVFMRPIHNLRNNIRTTGGRILRKVSPSHKQGIKIENTAARIQEKEAKIMEKLDELEKASVPKDEDNN